MEKQTWRTIGAAGYAAIGIAAFVRPQMVPRVFGGTADVAPARTEIRTVYGALPLAVAAQAVGGSSGARSGAILSGAMATGRAVSLVLEPESVTGANKLFLGVELALMIALGLGSLADGDVR